jgi:NitT/TauT family transport system permease protein
MNTIDLAKRPEYVRPVTGTAEGVIQKPLTVLERIYKIGSVRKGCLLILLALLWEGYARHLDNPLLFPTLSSALEALYTSLFHGELLARIGTTFQILLTGYLVGVVLAAILVVLAMSFTLANDLLEVLTAMFNPLPAIALLPLSLIWFGLGMGSLVFVIVHSVMWAIALNTQAGFMSVSQTLRMVGRNYGLRGVPFVVRILIPAAFPSILTGLKIGWAFAWRTLIAAEFIFGVSSGQGGLGWFIFENKNTLNIPEVFAGLLTVILIGLFVQNVIFNQIETRTIRRWGMQI